MKRLFVAWLATLASSTLIAGPPHAFAAALPINQIQNPSFETVANPGQLLFNPWLINTKSGAAATIHVDPSTQVSGRNSARIDVSQTNGYFWGVQLDQTVSLVAGSTYTISFYAKASAPVSIPIALQQSVSPYTVYYSPAASATTAWKQFTFQYSSNVTNPTALLHLDLGVSAGSIWFDDVSVTASSSAPPPPANTYFRGVNLKGGDQGLYSTADAFAPPSTLDWLKSKGLTRFRVSIAWAHLQPAYYAPLDATYLGMMDTLVANARTRGESVAFVPMDRKYAPAAALVDLWAKLALHYRYEPAIWGYDLMNEPTGDNWNLVTAPAIIAAIRSVDMNHTIVVPTSVGGWGQYWNVHTVGLPMQDPAHNLLYEAHFYFDTPANGQYLNGFDVPNGDLNIGVERATDFVTWCRANNVPCYAGEYGIPGGWTGGSASCTNGAGYSDPRWLAVLDNFLTYLDQNHISGAYWEAGPFGDVNDLGPTCSGQDRPQMAILHRHPGTTL